MRLLLQRKCPSLLKWKSICKGWFTPSRDTFTMDRFLWHRDGYGIHIIFNLDSMDNSNMLQDDLVELPANRIQMQFESMQLDMFWCAQLKPFPQLAERPLEVIVPFATTFLCVFQHNYTSKQSLGTVWMQVTTCVWHFGNLVFNHHNWWNATTKESLKCNIVYYVVL